MYRSGATGCTHVIRAGLEKLARNTGVRGADCLRNTGMHHLGSYGMNISRSQTRNKLFVVWRAAPRMSRRFTSAPASTSSLMHSLRPSLLPRSFSVAAQ